jgi:hypothetical protein
MVDRELTRSAHIDRNWAKQLAGGPDREQAERTREASALYGGRCGRLPTAAVVPGEARAVYCSAWNIQYSFSSSAVIPMKRSCVTGSGSAVASMR